MSNRQNEFFNDVLKTGCIFYSQLEDFAKLLGEIKDTKKQVKIGCLTDKMQDVIGKLVTYGLDEMA